MHRRLALVSAIALAACGTKPPPVPSSPKEAAPEIDVFDSWYDPAIEVPHGTPPIAAERTAALDNPNAKPIVIRGAKVMTANGQIIDDGTVVLEQGHITFVGAGDAPTPDGATVIDGKGKVVTPGLIDAHSHLGVYASPASKGTDDGNEATAPVTAQVSSKWSYWAQDPQIPRALAGGVTTALILPGSANLIGGRGFTVQMRAGKTVDDVAFPGAPYVVKMACGENPKRTYGEKGGPSTRMGMYAGFRAAFAEGAAYLAKWREYRHQHALWEQKVKRAAELDAAQDKAGKKAHVKTESAPEPPPRDLKDDTIAAILTGEVLVQIHCYKADDMEQMMDIADEYGFQIRSFHHSLEAYKIRDRIIAHGIAINTWSDWWGFKLEAYDGIRENAGLFTASGGRATIHSDSEIGIQRLNQDASVAMAASNQAGIPITPDQALRWITANPAWVLGIDDVTGTLEVGKRADVVVWSGDPFSVYSKAQIVIEAGEVAYDRSKGRPETDYELGHSAQDADSQTKPAGGAK
jgi:imidazolonepropionase-like amidohydrolase